MRAKKPEGAGTHAHEKTVTLEGRMRSRAIMGVSTGAALDAIAAAEKNRAAPSIIYVRNDPRGGGQEGSENYGRRGSTIRI